MHEPAQVEATRQVAVVDCGTSSVRAFIAQLPSDGGDPLILEDLSFPVDLTEAFVSGKLSRQAMDGVVEAFVNACACARHHVFSAIALGDLDLLRRVGAPSVPARRSKRRLARAFGIPHRPGS